MLATASTTTATATATGIATIATSSYEIISQISNSPIQIPYNEKISDFSYKELTNCDIVYSKYQSKLIDESGNDSKFDTKPKKNDRKKLKIKRMNSSHDYDDYEYINENGSNKDTRKKIMTYKYLVSIKPLCSIRCRYEIIEKLLRKYNTMF